MRNIKRGLALAAASLSLVALGVTSAAADSSETAKDPERYCVNIVGMPGPGAACYQADTNEIAALDFANDGEWMKAVVETSDGRTFFCGEPPDSPEDVTCRIDIADGEKVRVRPEAWYEDHVTTVGQWSKWTPA